jgi:hypothetical protein
MSEKEIKLSGGALAGVTSGGRRRRSTTRKNRQEGGDNSGALMQLAPVSAATNAGIPQPTAEGIETAFRSQVGDILKTQFGPEKIQQFGGRKRAQHGGDGIAGTIQKSANYAPTTPGNPPPAATVSGINPSQPAPISGGARVVLAPPKRKTRIALKAKKGGSTAMMNDKPPMPGGGHTRKARKIHLRVKGVTSRLAKAKKARKTAMNAPLSTVKSRLEAAGVIKKGSKAPEPMLRNMYADLLITKKGL